MVNCTGKNKGDSFKGCGANLSKFGNVTYKLCHKCNNKRLLEAKEPKKATGQSIVFNEIWKEREHKSFLSNKSVEKYENTKLWYNLFAHVLSKALNKYHKYILNKDNIILLTPEEHTLFDHASEDQRQKYAVENNCNWNKIYKLKEQLIKNYINEHKTSFR